MSATGTASETSVSVDTYVDSSIDHAFRVFTDGIGSWWNPDHHLFDAPLESMTFEPWAGGHIIDRYADGRECRWARVLAHEPPTRVAFSWDVSLDWHLESDLDKTSEVEVRFVAVAPQRTDVVLSHSNVARHGDGLASMRSAATRGWNLRRHAEIATGG